MSTSRRNQKGKREAEVLVDIKAPTSANGKADSKTIREIKVILCLLAFWGGSFLAAMVTVKQQAFLGSLSLLDWMALLPGIPCGILYFRYMAKAPWTPLKIFAAFPGCCFFAQMVLWVPSRFSLETLNRLYVTSVQQQEFFWAESHSVPWGRRGTAPVYGLVDREGKTQSVSLQPFQKEKSVHLLFRQCQILTVYTGLLGVRFIDLEDEVIPSAHACRERPRP